MHNFNLEKAFLHPKAFYSLRQLNNIESTILFQLKMLLTFYKLLLHSIDWHVKGKPIFNLSFKVFLLQTHVLANFKLLRKCLCPNTEDIIRQDCICRLKFL